MSFRCCKNCKYYYPPKEQYICGTCEYPVPEYLRTQLSGGNFINNAGYNGRQCSVFQSNIVIEEEQAK